MASDEVRLRDHIERAIAAERALADLGESIEDEWSYVNDLDASWAARLAALAEARGEELVDDPIAAAVDEAIAESRAVSDPHRAIDWLSTLPQVVLLAFGELA